MRRTIPTRRTATRGSLPSPNTQVVQLLVTASFCLIVMSFLPMIVLEVSEVNHEVSALLTHMTGANNHEEHHSPVTMSSEGDSKVSKSRTIPKQPPPMKTTKDGRHIFDLTLDDLIPDPPQWDQKPVARGIAGRPLSQTPHVATAKRAHLDCGDLAMDSLAYWNVGGEILRSPFSTKKPHQYVTFSPDRGGWNNVRMSLEIIFVIAAATGRTLVLPPKEPLYLMHHDKANRYRGFGDFFPLEQLHPVVPVLSFQDFFESPHRPPVPSHIDEAAIQKAADHCDKRDASENACRHVFDYLEATGVHQNISAVHTCMIFDETAYVTGKPPTNATILEHVQQVCGPTRDQVYFTQEMNDPDILFFAAGNKTFRLLTHFYGMIHFTNPVFDNYFRRFVRDYLHYHEAIYCAAGKIVKAIQKEAALLNANITDPKYAVSAEDGSGGYSALHVRRGDLQYKKVKIPAQEWYDNTKDVWYPKELLYIATDERDKSFFDDIRKHHELRFLDDYWELADLSSLDPNYMGMIDTIVASRGRAYAGTWFSTFSGYINRLRGYHGLSMQDSWYGFLPKKEAVHEWKLVNEFAYAYEWPDGWIGIDADVWPDRDKF